MRCGVEMGVGKVFRSGGTETGCGTLIHAAQLSLRRVTQQSTQEVQRAIKVMDSDGAAHGQDRTPIRQMCGFCLSTHVLPRTPLLPSNGHIPPSHTLSHSHLVEHDGLVTLLGDGGDQSLIPDDVGTCRMVWATLV